MPDDDTIKLLKECNAGIKMARKSIQEVISRVDSKTLQSILEKFDHEHEKLLHKTSDLLNEFHDTEKEPSSIAEVMSWLKINVKLLPEAKDSEIAELMIDGCNMGIKSLSRYMNQYKACNHESKEISENLKRIEQKMMNELLLYL